MAADSKLGDKVSNVNFHPFLEFPSPSVLREANKLYRETNPNIAHGKGGLPVPAPPLSSKSAMFDVKKSKELDQYAASAPVSLYTGKLEDVIEYLTKVAQTDVEKVRAIFRWILAQELGSILDTAYDKSPLGYLTAIKQTPTGATYVDLFVDLCKLVKITARPIEGYVKKTNHLPGSKKFDEDTWAAVIIDDSWYFIDLIRASPMFVHDEKARFLLSDADGIRPMPAKVPFDEAFFLANSDQLIFSHFPKEGESMQMLARPVTRNEFEQLAYLRPAFFRLGLEPSSHREGVVMAKEGELELIIGLPAKGLHAEFMYRLWISQENVTDEMTSDKLERFVFMQRVDGGTMLQSKLSFPAVGKYKFDVYACTHLRKPTRVYELVCVYVIICDQPKLNLDALPISTTKEWGPSAAEMDELGISVLSNAEAKIEVEDGMCEIRFGYTKPIEMLAKLTGPTAGGIDLKRMMIHRYENGEVVFEIKLPLEGEYALNLFAKPRGAKTAPVNICNYLLSNSGPPMDLTPFPAELPNGRLGAPPDVGACIVRPKSHPTAHFKATDSGQVEITMTAPADVCDLQVQMKLQTANGIVSVDPTAAVLTVDPAGLTAKLTFKERGMYLVTFLGKPAGSTARASPLYNYLFDAPKPLAQGGHGRLKPPPISHANPDEIPEPPTEDVKVALYLPGAMNVRAVMGGAVTDLQRGKDARWHGILHAGVGEDRLGVTVQAEMEGGGVTTFNTQYTYTVTGAKELRLLQDEQETESPEAELIAKLRLEKLLKDAEEFQKIKDELFKSIKDFDLKAMETITAEIDKRRYVTKLKEMYQMAKRMMRLASKTEALRQAMQDMDRSTMSEVAHYSNPPEIVHRVVMATLLVLGDDEEYTASWTNCQRRLQATGADSIRNRVGEFKPETLNAEIAARAMQLMQCYRTDDVASTSLGAAVFYHWAVGMCQASRELRNDICGNASPATGLRQKTIFAVDQDIPCQQCTLIRPPIVV